MLSFSLNAVEARILGVLLEKQMATPDYYPLTLNALVAGCNQKTNRDPVMDLDEETIGRALDELKKQHLVWQIKTAGSRAAKYEHNLKEVAEFSVSELGILCELLLRGPQTAGELRARTARLTEFHGLPAVEHVLRKLMEHEKGPFVAKLPRRPGHKECRYTQLFHRGPEDEGLEKDWSGIVEETAAGREERMALLEAGLEELRAELMALKDQFSEFKKQFE